MSRENCPLCGSNNQSSYFHFKICTKCYEYLRDCFRSIFQNEGTELEEDEEYTPESQEKYFDELRKKRAERMRNNES